jgi:long-chain acyl-CoA synthetase
MHMETLPLETTHNLGDILWQADPSKTAIIDCRDWQRPQSLSYAALNEQADALARGLLARGLKRSERIAILSSNRAEFVAAYLGAMRAGLVPVPVNHKFPPAMVELVLTDCAPRLILCDAERRRSLPGRLAAVEFGAPEWQALQRPGPFEAIVPEEREAAMVLYTSGSSGRPKGVVLSHAGHLWAIRMRLRGGPYDQHRLLIAAPLFHMNGLGTLKFALAAGATVVLLPQFDTRRYIEAIARFGASWLTAVPPMLAMMFREKALLEASDVSSVKAIRMGSAPVSEQLHAQIRAAFPNAKVVNVYGTTEAGPVVFGPDPKGRPKPESALGWPQPGVDLRLVDSSGREGDEGELWQRTPAVMLGYLNDPQRTAAVLTSDGWYKSGDVFRRDASGCYWFVGRVDDMFVSGGENIFPSEVELVLSRHPDVAQACVVPVPDEIKGTKPVAFVVPRPGAAPTEDEIKRHVLANAPAYQHPRRVMFLRELPLASTNKVDRKLLERMALERWQAALDPAKEVP